MLNVHLAVMVPFTLHCERIVPELQNLVSRTWEKTIRCFATCSVLEILFTAVFVGFCHTWRHWKCLWWIGQLRAWLRRSKLTVITLCRATGCNLYRRLGGDCLQFVRCCCCSITWRIVTEQYFRAHKRCIILKSTIMLFRMLDTQHFSGVLTLTAVTCLSTLRLYSAHCWTPWIMPHFQISCL